MRCLAASGAIGSGQLGAAVRAGLGLLDLVRSAAVRRSFLRLNSRCAHANRPKIVDLLSSSMRMRKA
jgi:hypothetical protein